AAGANRQGPRARGDERGAGARPERVRNGVHRPIAGGASSRIAAQSVSGRTRRPELRAAGSRPLSSRDRGGPAHVREKGARSRGGRHLHNHAAEGGQAMKRGVKLLMGLAAACGAHTPTAQPPPPMLTVEVPTAAPPPVDPLGPRPQPSMPPPFLPPAPAVLPGVNGIKVWLLERHQVPEVSCDMTVPSGASSDPKQKAGLAYVTANMLDEGAGARGAIDLARAID